MTSILYQHLAFPLFLSVLLPLLCLHLLVFLLVQIPQMRMEFFMTKTFSITLSGIMQGLSSAPPIPAGIWSFRWNSGGFWWNEIWRGGPANFVIPVEFDHSGIYSRMGGLYCPPLIPAGIRQNPGNSRNSRGIKFGRGTCQSDKKF
jgi:hypothetical protein